MKNVSVKGKASKLFLLALIVSCIIVLPVSATIIQPPITSEMAEELAVEAFRESLIDAYDVEVVSVRRATVEHPMDSGNYTDAWYVAVSGKGTERPSGMLVGCTTDYTIIIDSGEVVEGVTVGAGIAKISYRGLILDGIVKLSTPILISFMLIIIGVIWRKRTSAR